MKFRRFLIKPLLVLLLCFLGACSGNSSGEPSRNNSDLAASPVPQRITAETAYQMMRESGGFILLDVRTLAEFRERHIAGAILIPHTEIAARSASELPDKNSMIFVYCRTGVRSANAARTLAGMGYLQVFDFGGIVDWPFGTVRGD